jgi:hypothetical protein
MLRKRGQVEVVAVVIGIAVLSLLYLVFVPLTEKCKIIPTLPECSSQAIQKEIIFEAKPGFLKQQLEHAYYSLSPVELFTKNEIETASILHNVETEKTIFTTGIQTGTFSIYGKVEKIKLFIAVREHNGALKVKVNGNQVAVLKGDGVLEAEVPISDLKKENTLTLESTTPLLPWGRNYYTIDNVQIEQFYSVFKLSQTETLILEENLSDVSSAKLSLWVDCIGQKNLVIMLNNLKLLDDYSCGLKSFDVKLAKSNTFVFKSDGDYYLHDIKLDLKFKVNDYPTYHFDLNTDDLNAIKSGKKSSLLGIQFDSSEEKSFDLYVNGILVVKADTVKINWQASIDRWLVDGQNSIKIIPRTDVNILDLKLEI